jgi:hypothetical protein
MGRWMGKPASDPDSPTGPAAAALVRGLPDGSWGADPEARSGSELRRRVGIGDGDHRLGARPRSAPCSMARSRAAGERCLRGTGGAVTRGDIHVERVADERCRSRGRGRGTLAAEDGLRLDDEQTRPPASPQAGKPYPEDPISSMEPRAFGQLGPSPPSAAGTPAGTGDDSSASWVLLSQVMRYPRKRVNSTSESRFPVAALPGQLHIRVALPRRCAAPRSQQA